MITVVICIGRKGSKGFPDKNKYRIKDHPMLAYPLMAALDCASVDYVFYSTDDPEQAEMAEYYGAIVIDRPEELATDEALGEDVFFHALDWIKGEYENKIEFVVTLFASAPCITSVMIEEMIGLLRKHMNADSICTVSKYNMYSPYRARRVDGIWTMPFLEEDFLKRSSITCDRDSGMHTYIYDISCAVVRPYCIEHLRDGIKPMRWLGRKVLHYNKYNDIPRCDVDYEWQLGQVECWIDKYWKG